MMKKKFRPFACGLWLLLSAACNKEEQPEPASTLPTRTVLVYMAGDNDLSNETTQKIEAMRRGWTRCGSNLLVYADDKAHGARLLRFCRGGGVDSVPYVEVIREYGAENSASAETLHRILREVTAEYSADSYGLIFFSHASGWLPAGSLQNPTRSLGRDDGAMPENSDQTEIELRDFAAAIPDGALDFIVFESCLTAEVEVAYELRRKADYILASSAEILSPGFTPVYPTALRYLLDTFRPVADALEAFGCAYMDYVNTLTGDSRSATLSLINTAGLDSLATRTAELLSCFSLGNSTDIIDSLQHFDRPGSYGDSPESPRCFDLGQWAEMCKYTAQYTVFEEQLMHTVKWEESTKCFLPSQNGFRIRRHSGLTTYIEQPGFAKLNEYYHTTSWYKAVHRTEKIKQH